MNKIIFAGYYKFNAAMNINKQFAVILPAVDGKLLLQTCSLQFNAGNILIVPPFSPHTVSPFGKHLTVIIEQAVIPFKEPLIISDDEAGGIAHAANRAEKYSKSSLPKKDRILSALGALIAAYAGALADNKGFSPIVKRIYDDIESNVSNAAYSVEQTLNSLPFNYDYARKLFGKEVGNTPHGELLRKRMELAASLLSGGKTNLYTNYSVSQVAESCGFSDPLYFSRVFKKYYGIAPSDYK